MDTMTLPSPPPDDPPSLPLTPREQATLDLRTQRRATRAAVYGDFRTSQGPVDVKPFEGKTYDVNGNVIHPWMFR